MDRRQYGWKRKKEERSELPPIWKHIPQLSLEERDRRWERIRRKMSREGFDCLLVFGSDMMMGLTQVNFRYITSIRALGHCLVIFPLEGDPIAFIGTPHNLFYKGMYTWIKDIRPAALTSEIIGTVKELGYQKGRIAIPAALTAPGGPFDSLLYHQWTNVQKELPDVTFIEDVHLLDELIIIKSPEERRCMEQAAKISTLAYKALVETAKPGVKECEVYGAMKCATIANGGDPDSMLLMDSGNPPLTHPRDIPPTTRKLEKGDIIIVEYHTSYAGYQAGTCCSVSLGEPTKEKRRLFEVVKEAYTVCVNKIKPGASFREAVEAQRAVVYKAGMEWVESGYHLHGLGSCEWPDITTNTITPDSELPLIKDYTMKENMVLCPDQTLYDPKRVDEGSLTLGFTHIVTKDGQRQLEDIPWTFAVV